jgi:hypothetical protein
MVEYAILLAGTSLGTISAVVSNANVFLAGLNWGVLSYLLLGLVVLRLAFWVFRTPR